MFGPGKYVPDPTEGIIDIQDLPAPQIVAYDRNLEHTPCLRCGHLCYRHKWGERTLHSILKFFVLTDFERREHKKNQWDSS